MLSLLKFMKAFIVLFIAVICISFSCTKSVLSKYSDDLKGTWILKRMSGGFAGQTTTPNKLTTLTFQSSEKYSTSYNNQPADKGTYTTTKAGQPNYYSTDILLKLFSHNNNDTLTYGVQISKDRLFLDEGCCDRFSYLYIRQK